MKTSNDQLHEPGNHIWNSRCNGLHLCCELVPICNISICIWYISYVENYIIIWQVLDELVSSVKCTRIFTTVFIWAITFSLARQRSCMVIWIQLWQEPKWLKKKSDVFLGEMMIFFWLIVSRGKSNEENKLKIVTSLRFYG